MSVPPSKRPSRSRTIRQQAVAELESLPRGYSALLDDLKIRIRTAQVKATLSVNRELIALYWHIGQAIVGRQQAEGWGSGVVARLSADLQREFKNVGGFSVRNVRSMRAFYLAWTEEVRSSQESVGDGDGETLPEVVAQIPWGHNLQLLARISEPRVRLWYAEQTLAHGWSRNVLVHQIVARLHERQGKALHNFRHTLPPLESDLAQQALKDPYVFDFLTLTADVRERELEQALIDHVQSFLLELGLGFAFVGRQVRLEVGNQDFFVDLLFYHLKLRCFVVIDLKARPFEPEFVGKMNFYLSAVDAKMRHASDGPSIGLLLCKSKDRLVVEYALRGFSSPIGVADWETQLVESLPEELKGSLPTVEELEIELGREGET